MITLSSNTAFGNVSVTATEEHADRLVWALVAFILIVAVVITAKQLKAIQ